jgi:L-alanine-DL-glutamate epimerase-like enolase superfamily enzyme
MKTHRRRFLQTAGLAAAAAFAPSYAGSKTYYYHGRSNAYQLPKAVTEPTGVTIKRIETYHQNSTVAFTRVVMDDGTEGWGQISTYDADVAASLLHRKMAYIALDQDPADWDRLVDRLVEANYKWPWSYVCRALGGLDTAIWDWFGKREEKSVCALLGGTPRPFPVYGSSMSRSITPEKEAERLKRLRDEKGYTAFKIRVGKTNGHNQDQWPGRSEEIVPTVRKALGEDIHLMADGNSGFTPPRALEIGRLMQDNNYYFYEEPCPYWEYDWTREVTQALTMKVSGGEQDNDLGRWRTMIEDNVVDIVQPDILYLGGINRTLRVAAMAQEKGMPCVPHSANRAMVTVFSLHMLGAIPNAGTYVEYSIEKTPWSDELYTPKLEVKDGAVQIPEEPGWGVTIRQDWLEKAERQVSERQ